MVIAGLHSFNERIAQSVAFMEWGFRAWTQVPLAQGRAWSSAARRSGMGTAADVGLAGATDLRVDRAARLWLESAR